MGEVNSYAIFDFLFVAERLKSIHIGDISEFEVNLISYYACLLSLYDGRPVSFWGYKFLRNQSGVPISDSLVSSRKALVSAMELAPNDDFLRISSKGQERLEALRDLMCFKQRKKYLQAACSCLAYMPAGVFRAALFQEPLIGTSVEESVGYLVDDSNAALPLLYDHFSMMKSTLGECTDVRIPAFLWLRFLRETK